MINVLNKINVVICLSPSKIHQTLTRLFLLDVLTNPDNIQQLLPIAIAQSAWEPCR